jgi:hypothetical protein
MSAGAQHIPSDAPSHGQHEPALELDMPDHTSMRPGQWLGPLGPANVSPKAQRMDRVPVPSGRVREPVDLSMQPAPLAALPARAPSRAGLDPCLLLALGLSTPDGGAGGQAVGHVPPTRAGVLMAFAARWRRDRIALRHHIWKAVHAGDLERALALAEVWEALDGPRAQSCARPASSPPPPSPPPPPPSQQQQQQQQQTGSGEDWRQG